MTESRPTGRRRDRHVTALRRENTLLAELLAEVHETKATFRYKNKIIMEPRLVKLVPPGESDITAQSLLPESSHPILQSRPIMHD